MYVGAHGHLIVICCCAYVHGHPQWRKQPYYASTDFVHPPVLITGANMAQEIARQPIIVLMILKDIWEAVISVFNMMVKKKDEMSCILFSSSNNRSDSQHDTYFWWSWQKSVADQEAAVDIGYQGHSSGDRSRGAAKELFPLSVCWSWRWPYPGR